MTGKKDSTGSTTRKGEAERVIAGVGGIRSSEENMPDLFWSGENMEERRDATCSAGRKSKEGRGDGPRGLPAPDKVRQLQIILYRKAKSKPGYRFWSLYGEVQRADVLKAAWRRVKANGGTAGVDGETRPLLRIRCSADSHRESPLLNVRNLWKSVQSVDDSVFP